MIPMLAGWAVETLPDAFAMKHPSGGATIRYRERAGRPRRIGVLASEIMARWPHLAVRDIGPVERMRTAEGELAAALAIECEDAGRKVSVDLGFVFTDDFFTSLASTCRDPALRVELAATVRELIEHDTLALGARRRRFEYQPPPGWQPVRQGLATEWLSPAYPRCATTLLVNPANPISVAGPAYFGAAHEYLEQHGCKLVLSGPIETSRNRHGMAVSAQTVRFHHAGEPCATRYVLLADALYQYPLELRTRGDSDACEYVLDAIVDSIVPFGPTGTLALSHWNE